MRIRREERRAANMLCFIVNEHSRSGKGAKIWKEAEAVLKKKNIAYESYVTQYEG